MKKVAVIGGGAAGMMAAISAAKSGHSVSLYEKNEKLGKKIYITGKGRCNVTNACELSDFFNNVVTNPKFLYSSIYGFGPSDLMDIIETHGTPLKIERGNRVFPVSDKASDITKALSNALKEAGVRVFLNEALKGLVVEDGQVKGIETLKNRYEIDAVIMATGGLSYPSTGSNGDGHKILDKLGVKITDMSPGLTSIDALEPYVFKMQGLSLKNVALKIYDDSKCIFDEFGQMLFTHKGISGPIVLSASSLIGKRLLDKDLKAYIDLKPAIDKNILDKRLIGIIEENRGRHYSNFFKGLVPATMAPILVELSMIEPGLRIGDITKEKRHVIVDLLKAFPLTLTGIGGYNEAVITRGGVEIKQVDPATMALKQIKGLYVAGELLDVDALTGGFNLQIAFSTGYAAGRGIE